MIRFTSGLAGLALTIATVVGLSAAPAAAQDSATSRPQLVRFDIKPGTLSQMLARFSEISGVQLVYSSEFVKGLRGEGLTGELSAADALTTLLQGTGLVARFSSPTTATLIRSGGASRVLGPVRVEGAVGAGAGVAGINGSTDATATEGTGSYTSSALSIGSKMPQSMKDTTQSVSVLTSQRMQDQNITDFSTAMNQLAGVTQVQASSSVESTFYSRGFAITSIQVDGGAPLQTTFSSYTTGQSIGFFPQIDLSQYDHVELLRGAEGLFNGYGQPGGTVNLVRKRPLDHRQVTLETQAGSWENYRTVLDATAPLSLDGALRGRLVATYQDNDHFYDIAHDNKSLLYGILEYDLTPSTLASGGVSHTRQDSVPCFSGLPRYQNGDDLGLPRSECLTFPWSRWDFDTTELFAKVEQKLGEKWHAKLNVTYNEQNGGRLFGAATGAVNPITLAGPTANASKNDYSTQQLGGELTLDGAFDVAGQRQQVVLGVNFANTNGAGYQTYSSGYPSTYTPYPGGPVGVPAVDVFHFNPYSAVYSAPPPFVGSNDYGNYGQIQSGAYLNVRLTAFDRLHLQTGIRYSQYEYNYGAFTLCRNTTGICAGRQVGDRDGTATIVHHVDSDFSWPPSASLSYDVTDRVSAYVGYADIYQTQEQDLDRNLKPLDPIVGSNIEAGAKWESQDRTLNASLAGFRIEQKNYAYAIENPLYTDNFGNVYPQGKLPDGQRSCCYHFTGRRQLSQGLDAEISGALTDAWQISASYTWNKTELSGSEYGTSEGQPIVSRQPRQLLKLWSSYKPHSGGLIDRFTLSGGINAQTKAFQAGTVCINYVTNASGAAVCQSSRAPDSVSYSFTQKAYAVLSSRIDYNVTENWATALNINNLLDKRYYQTMGNATNNNWYGEPRSYMFTVSGRF